MVFKVEVRYMALASIEIDVPSLDGCKDLPDPAAVVNLFRENLPELLRVPELSLVYADAVIVGNEEIVIDRDCV